jgi:broad specificity phosphatase PhoE
MRHGRTDANAQGLMCGGDWDIELNAEGRSQVDQAVEKFLKINNTELPTAICSSPMKRTLQSAEPIAKQFKIPLIQVEELREWRVGDWESKPWGEVPDPFSTTRDPANGETRMSFEERVIHGVSKGLKMKGPILFVAHGAVWHALTKPLKIDLTRIPNASPVFVELVVTGLEAKWQIKLIE